MSQYLPEAELEKVAKEILNAKNRKYALEAVISENMEKMATLILEIFDHDILPVVDKWQYELLVSKASIWGPSDPELYWRRLEQKDKYRLILELIKDYPTRKRTKFPFNMPKDKGRVSAYFALEDEPPKAKISLSPEYFDWLGKPQSIFGISRLPERLDEEPKEDELTPYEQYGRMEISDNIRLELDNYIEIFNNKILPRALENASQK